MAALATEDLKNIDRDAAQAAVDTERNAMEVMKNSMKSAQ